MRKKWKTRKYHEKLHAQQKRHISRQQS